jgi:hypothetical protein
LISYQTKTSAEKTLKEIKESLQKDISGKLTNFEKRLVEVHSQIDIRSKILSK